MEYPEDDRYYIKRKPELLQKFDEELWIWRPIVIKQYGQKFADKVLREARKEFESLIPAIPYIGGDENRYTNTLIDSVRYLAFYKVMKKRGKTSEETGRILCDAILEQAGSPRPAIPPAERLTPEQLNERRSKAAEKSQERRYSQDYVYTFIIGDGIEFDYGYDFTECASLKFYHAQSADEFLPFYCYLDFIAGKARGVGFSRTMTLPEGCGKCNHRFKIDGETEIEWPPPFLKRK
jgi:hypothetical protein